MMNESRFCPGTNVLKNKLGITDSSELKRAESAITSLSVAELRISPIKGNYDLDHLKHIHRHIFESIYEWAGQVRELDIEKATTTFCPINKFEETQIKLFTQLANENRLKGLSPEEFSDRAAYYLGEINNLHPFYEGNGRTQREFMYQLGKAAGHNLDLTLCSNNQMIKASFDYYNGDNHEMRKMVFKTVLNLNDEEVLKVIDRFDRYKKIVNDNTPDDFSSKSKDIIVRYLSLAKKIIQENEIWPGEVADKAITKDLLKLKFPRYKIENVLSSHSIETAGMSSIDASRYAKNTVRDLVKTISFSKSR